MSYIGKEPEFTQYPSKFFNGDGTAMTVTLDYAPPNAAALLVFIDGVRQDTTAYTLSGTSMTFTGTVPSGTNNVQVVHMGLAIDVGTPGDDTVTAAKLADTAVTPGSYTASSITVDQQGRLTAASSGAFVSETSATGSAELPSGTTVQRDGSPSAGYMRFNSTDGSFEGYDGSAWGAVGGGTSWQAVVTTGTTMVAGRGYFVDTTGSAFSMTLPTSASLGDEVHIIDYAGTFDTNNCTVDRNSHNISGAASDLVVATERAAFKLVYVDASQGWLLTEV